MDVSEKVYGDENWIESRFCIPESHRSLRLLGMDKDVRKFIVIAAGTSIST